MVEVPDDLAEPEHAHRHHDEADAVGEVRDLEGEPLGAGRDVGPDQPEEEAEQHHADGVQQRALRQHDRRHQAQHHEREVLGRAEPERDRRQRRAERGDQERGHGPGEERADRRGGEGGPARPWRAIW